jgi:hypothetical protein
VQPKPVLQERVVEALGVDVEIEPEVNVPNAVEELSVEQVTLVATVAVTVTVEPLAVESHMRPTRANTLIANIIVPGFFIRSSPWNFMQNLCTNYLNFPVRMQ